MCYHFGGRKCSCVGKNGQPKNLYSSRQEAQDMANYRRSCGGDKLRMYECPEGVGWHLTKELNEWSVYG